MLTTCRRLRPFVMVGILVSCAGGDDPAPPVPGPAAPAPVASIPRFVVEDVGPVDPVSVATLDRPTAAALGDSTLPVEARILVLSANGQEPELAAIRSVLDYRGARYDVFIANQEAALTASRLQSGDHGFYQATILTSSSLSISGTSTLSSSEWAVLASYEAAFMVRRAVLAASPDLALGFGSSSTQNTSTSPLTVRCTTAGLAVFRDVKCTADQKIAGDTAYLSSPVSGAPLTPLLTDSAGHALAAVHVGSDGRESLLLLYRNATNRLHSQLFLHGVLGWVTGGTYLGERRIDLGVQIDDMFIGATGPSGVLYRLDGDDLAAALDWVQHRRSNAITPNFRWAWAFNGTGAEDGDSLTEEARAHSAEWDWINHGFEHHLLDHMSYADTYEELLTNIQLAAEIPLIGFDVRNIVTGNYGGLVNSEALRAATDLGVRYAVMDTSADGCNNPSPNTTFYNAYASTLLMIPRRPTNLFYNVSTPAEWVDMYNDLLADHWGYESTYAQVLDQESDVLLQYLMRGEADPWMFHQADVRAYDGVHSLLGDLLDATLTKLEARLQVPVRTPRMHDLGQRFARRLNFEGAGVRATLFRGRALVIDAGRSVAIPVTGVRAADGESYGGEVIGLVNVSPGTSTCVPLDSAGLGCTPAPVREGGPGPTQSLPLGVCDTHTDDPPPPPPPAPEGEVTAIAPRSTWRYRDVGGDLGSAWRARTYDDSAWSSGAGPLGYGEPYQATTVSYGPSASSKYITTYFRRTFVIDDPSEVTGLRGELMYDDGAVVYLNGTEIGRAAMPSGTVTASTRSTGYETGNHYQAFDWTGGQGLLVAGTNTLAVEVHQAWPDSSDLTFDLALILDTGTPPPPPPVEEGGVPAGATWSYWDNGGDLGTTWRTSAGGTGWDTGPAPLGYGESYLATTVGYGPSAASKYITTYFTTTFTVEDAGAVTSMIGRVMYDDGFVAYLNGVELGRAAMPAGTVTASTRSTGYETGNHYQDFDWSTSAPLLVDGTNILAVEVHQAWSDSSDLTFDLALELTGP